MQDKMPKIEFKVKNVGPLYAAAFISSKSRIYLGNSSKCSVVCYITKSRRFCPIVKKSFSVYALEKSPNESLIFASGDPAEIYGISTKTQKIRFVLKNANFRVLGMQITKCGNFLYCVDSQMVHLWDLKQKKVIKSIRGLFGSEKRCLVLSKNQKSLYGTSQNSSLGFLRVSKGYRFTFLNSFRTYFRCHTLNCIETRLFSGSSNSIFMCHDLRSRKKMFKHNFGLSSITCLRAKNKKIFVSAYNEYLLILEDSAKLSILYQWKDSTFLFHLAIEGELLLTGGMQHNEIKVFDMKNLDTKQKLE